jgi:hypothetical protein
MNGTLQGNETTLVVAMYGAPASSTPTPPPPPPAPAPVPPPLPSTSNAQSNTSTEPEPSPASAEDTSAPKPEDQPPSPQATTKPEDNSKPPDQSGGEVQSVTEESIKAREELNWAQQSSLVLLSTLLLINVLKHTIVWRTKKRGWRDIWFRSHPAVQYALILLAITSTFMSSIGVIK